MPVEQWTSAVVPAVVGIVLIGSGVWRWHAQRRFDRVAVRTNARYVRDYHSGAHSSLSHDSPLRYASVPELTFRTADGREVTTIVVDSARSGPRPHLHGTDVPIRYDPANPERVVLESDHTAPQLRWPLLTGAGGVLALVVAGVIVFWLG
ncbi:DUF3592 domain-containing protein [Saccharopolyspora thermophila]|uniref:DUF3592 domain-containing protein n=1 Tax=Saccharopolyspora thermophila TaxID=89367 RepID=A0ABN1CSM2_9PSEU